MERQYDYIVKVVLIGTSSVGKSAILRRFADNEFNEFYISTIGIDFRFKSISIGDNYVKIQIWDTAGQQRFQGITKSYYTNADLALIVYDVKQSNSFDEIKSLWLREVRNYCKRDVKIVVFCNKCDNSSLFMKTVDKNYLDHEELQYFQMSAKTGEGVNEAILSIIEKLIKTLPRVEERRMMSLELKERESHEQVGRRRKDSQIRCCEK